MKVLIINGSPKMERSNSLKLTTAFVEGLCSACDAEVETITVAKLNINTCLGCLNCWKRTPGECFCYKNDDMAAANEKIIAADVVIWSFPLYYYSLPGLLKVFVDRQVPTMRPIMQERIDGKGNGKHASRYDLSHQRHILISTCGFCYYKGNYDAVKAQFDLILGVDNYTTLFCGQGEMLPVPFLKDRVDEAWITPSTAASSPPRAPSSTRPFSRRKSLKRWPIPTMRTARKRPPRRLRKLPQKRKLL